MNTKVAQAILLKLNRLHSSLIQQRAVTNRENVSFVRWVKVSFK